MTAKKLPAALSVPQQIENLKALGLTISDEQYAQDFLGKVSYFRFIKAYSLGLKPRNGNYYANTSFEQLVQLYEFNTSFRHLLFAQIEQVEVALRCRLANYFSVVYGVTGYLNSANFANEKFHAQFITEMQAEISRNRRAPFVSNFQANYENGLLPLYALVEIFRFGTLSKFYKNMKNSDKKAIAGQYGIPYFYFESWIESIAYVRNICAHYGRLYNAKLTKTPKLYRTETSRDISNARIFGVLCCMKYLSRDYADWQDFVKHLSELIEHYPAVNIQTMGFPDDWQILLMT